jgi:hypothetical protein
VVYGSPTNQAAFADSWDFADVNGVGQERFALAVDSFAPSAALAQAVAAQQLAREQRLGLAVRATLQPNPALELLDVVQFNDGAGNVQTRITELHLTYMPQDGHDDLVLVGEGV